MKKFFLLIYVFLLCGCSRSIDDDVINDLNSTNYGLAKNSILGYVKSVELAYTEYQYDSLLGIYNVREDSTLVNIDGVDVQLNVDVYGDEVKCDYVRIVGGSVKLDGCLVNGYSFSYDNQVIDR